MRPYLVPAATWAAGVLAVLLLGSRAADAQQSNTQAKGAPFPRQVTMYDRQGKVLRTVGEQGIYSQPALSPDGMRLAVVKQDPGPPPNADIWIFDLSTGKASRLTSNAGPESSPLWSPDEAHIAYVSRRENYGRIYRSRADGSGDEELLYQHTLGAGLTLTDWSADGQYLSFSSGGVLFTLSLNAARPRRAVELAREEFGLRGVGFSPDGRLVAYHSDESGRMELYVRPFDTSRGLFSGSGKWRVSNEGAGGWFYWRHDGRELYYIAADGGVMAVDVSSTPALEFGKPKLLFQVPSAIPRSAYASGIGNLSRDGQQFVFIVQMPPERREITVAPEILVKYVGSYATAGFEAVVTLEGDQLIMTSEGIRRRLFAESENYFFFKIVNGDIEFVKDDIGVVTHFLVYMGGQGVKVTRK